MPPMPKSPCQQDRHKEDRYSREQTEDKRERGDRREERKGRRAGSEERKRSRSPVPAPRVERDDTWKHDRCVWTAMYLS